MSDNAVTNTMQGAVFIPEIWSKKLENLLFKNCVMLQCVNRNYEGEIKNEGDTVNIMTPDTITVNTLGTDDITYETPDGTDQQLIIDQKKYFAFKVNDISKAQANTNIMEVHLQNAKKAIEEVQDTFLLGKHADVPSANVIGASTSVTLSADTIYAEFVELAKRLKNANALGGSQKPWVVINPTIEAYLLQASEFIHATQIGDKTIRDGAIGRIAGLDVLVSTNLTASSGITSVLAGTNDAITFASQITKMETLRDQNSFKDLVRGLYVYGAKTTQPKALAKLNFATA